ncbi:MAG: hypothetical protein H6Q70_525 [Firmicutes bacterium]|nr:hypothetical protein [Bacillota bacterium]
MAEQKITETIEFLTQIHTAWDNSEQRAALRVYPRRSVAYDYIGMNAKQSQYLRNLIYAGQTTLMQIPIWHAAYQTDRICYAGGNSAMVTPSSIWQYRGCSYIQLWLDDKYGGEIYPVTQYFGTGEIALNKQFTDNWAAGSTKIHPLAWAVLSKENKFSNTTAWYSSTTFNFEIIRESQAPNIPDALNYLHDETVSRRFAKNLSTDYNGYELFLTPPSWNNDLTASYTRNAERLDNESGTFVYDMRSTLPKETRELDYTMMSRSQINNLQRFFYRCMGRLKSFYYPTWLNDVDLAKDAYKGDIVLYTKFVYYWKYCSSNPNRKLLIVFYRNGSAEIIKVSGYSTDSTGEYGKIYLQSSLKNDLTNNNVAKISFLCKYRLDSDTLETDYETCEVASTTLSMVEVSD